MKVKWGSRITPSKRGFLSSGRGESSSSTLGLVWDWWLSEVKRVTVDLGREIARPLSAAQRDTWAAWEERALAAVGMSGEE